MSLKSVKKSFSNAEVKMVNGRSVFIIDDKPFAPMAFFTNERLTPEYAQRLADANINLYYLWVDSGWLNEDCNSSWDEMTKEARLILEKNSNAYIILRVPCYPPEKWLNENPDELEIFEDGRADHCLSNLSPYKDPTRMICLTSKKFREGVAEKLCSLLDRVENADFGHRVIGYFLNGGCCGEWCYSIDIDEDANVFGFSPAFKWFYTNWLKNKYGTEQNLKKAWNDETATFDNPKIPGRKDQLLTRYRYPAKGVARAACKADWGYFLSPKIHQITADFYEARTAGTADTIEYLAKTIKEKTNGRVVTGAFFGYMGTTQFQIGATSGPLFLAMSPWIDFLASPHNYEDRVPGGGATFRAPVDSLSLRGKLWVNESDSRTYKTSYSEQVSFGNYTLEDSINTLKRDFAQVICDDVQAFWFDIQPTWLKLEKRYSNYDDPDITALFKKQQKIAQEYYHAGRGKVSEIAIVYDQDSLWHLDSESLRDLVWLNRDITLPHIGAPCDHIFHDDLELDNLPDYKMFVFMNCFLLNEKERETISKIVKNAGKTAVWVYAPGLINPDAQNKMSIDNMKDLTGFNFGCEDAEREATFRIVNTDHLLTKGLSEYRLYGDFERPIMNTFDWKRGDIQIQDPSLCSPLFYVDDSDADVLGRFVTNDRAAYAVKDFGDWKSIYIGAKVMNPCILRTIAKSAGVHIYVENDDIVYANKHLMAIHAVVEEKKTISLPRKCKKIIDAYTDEVIAADCDLFELQMKNGETKMFRFL